MMELGIIGVACIWFGFIACLGVFFLGALGVDLMRKGHRVAGSELEFWRREVAKWNRLVLRAAGHGDREWSVFCANQSRKARYRMELEKKGHFEYAPKHKN